MLTRIAEIYRDNPGKVRDGTRELSAAVAALSQPESGAAPDLSPAFLDRAAAALLLELDPVYGGLRGAPKFPQLTSLELLWRAYLRGDTAAAGEAVTLDRMCQGGIYDHLAGGFARYSVDEAWLVPHFEKMLYDNAQFIALLTHIWRETQSPLYAARVAETVSWALRDLTNESGAFVSSYDADSESEEGRYTVWTAGKIDELLGNQSAPFKKAYDVVPGGNWEGATILNRSGRPELGSAEDEAALGRARAILLESRRNRTPPARDDKVLADWNGLMIAALAEAGTAFAEPGWIAAAERAFAAVLAAQSDGARLFHSSCDGSTSGLGFLDDYAAMARAALGLHEATGGGAYLDRARSWMRELDAHFRDPERGGYYYAAAHGDDRLLVRPRHARDTAQPSGNGLAAEVLARLSWADGSDATRAAAQAVFDAFAGDAAHHPVALATLLNAYDVFAGAVQVAVIGVRGEPAAGALLRAAFALPTMSRMIRVVAPGDSLPAAHPAAGKKQVDGGATAYVCVGPVCAAPVTDAAAVRQAWEMLR